MKTLKESLLDNENDLISDANDQIALKNIINTYKIINPLNRFYAGGITKGTDRFGRKLEIGDVICYTTEKTDELKKYGVFNNHTVYFGIVINNNPLSIALTMKDDALINKMRSGLKYDWDDLQIVPVTSKECAKIVRICKASDVNKYFS